MTNKKVEKTKKKNQQNELREDFDKL
jgi:hypothetical protein